MAQLKTLLRFVKEREAIRLRKVVSFDANTVARFWSHVHKLGTGCWIWAPVERDGYGRFCGWAAGKRIWSLKAHVYSYALHFPASRQQLLRCRTSGSRFLVCHSCDVPLCVNPDHLWLGPQSDNMKDMNNKGRRVPPDFSGSNNPMWGKTHTPKTRKMLRKTWLGKQRTVDTRQKMRQAWTPARRLAQVEVMRNRAAGRRELHRG